jgi:hypothetical protein
MGPLVHTHSLSLSPTQASTGPLEGRHHATGWMRSPAGGAGVASRRMQRDVVALPAPTATAIVVRHQSSRRMQRGVVALPAPTATAIVVRHQSSRRMQRGVVALPAPTATAIVVRHQSSRRMQRGVVALPAPTATAIVVRHQSAQPLQHVVRVAGVGIAACVSGHVPHVPELRVPSPPYLSSEIAPN